MISARCWSVAFSSLALLFARPAAAQQVDDATRGGARILGYAGVAAYQSGQYGVASEKLEKSYRVLKAPSLGLWSARALMKLDKWVEASERYREVSRLGVSGGDAGVQHQAQADAASELELLTPKIPSVVIQVQGAKPGEVKATLDGQPIAPELFGEATPVNPGPHTVEGRRGSEKQSVQIRASAGEEAPAVLRFSGAALASPTGAVSPAGSAPLLDSGGSSARRTLAWVTLGAGGVGLAVGGVTGAMAVGKKSVLDHSKDCANNVCKTGGSATDTVNGYNALRSVSSVGFIAGGVLAATGVVLLLTAPKSSEPGVALWVGPNSTGLRGAF